LPPPETFLGGLENQVHGPIEIAGLGEVAGGAQQHRRVPVMTAGVHATLMLRAIGEVGRLLDRQRVHIGPQPDGVRGCARAQPADHTGAADPTKDFEAEPRELRCDEIGGPTLLEPKLGVGMDIPAPTRQIVSEFCNALDDAHHRPPVIAVTS
jgi:hypothetical protein